MEEKTRFREEEETYSLEFDAQLPCGHIAYKGKREGLWINDEFFGWCKDCGAMYNAKVLRQLITNGDLEINKTNYITKKGIIK